MSDKPSDILRETQEIWDKNATFWDSIIGDAGNRFHRTVVEPTTLELLTPLAGESVPEIACGNGAFARTLARLGVDVVASDFSAALLERARERTPEGSGINYVMIDATQKEQLLGLGEKRFDAAVCNMALMDMPTIEPLFLALSRLLKPQGRCVFSVQHPCFNSNSTVKMVELEDRNGELATVYSVKVSNYLTPRADRGVGIVGQPTPHHLFHRPISLLLKAGFQAGFVLDALEEPTDKSGQKETDWSSWANYRETPPALVVRLRLKSQRDFGKL